MKRRRAGGGMSVYRVQEVQAWLEAWFLEVTSGRVDAE